MTPRSSHVWSSAYAGFLRSRAPRGGREEGGTGDDDWCSRDSAGPRREETRKEGCRGSRAGQGEAKAGSHTPLPRPAPSALRLCSAANPSVSPAPRWPAWSWAHLSQSWASGHLADWGWAGGGAPSHRALVGRWLPGRPGVVRAIPEKVCRAGLGEQRAGGGPGVFADLFVTQSLLPGVSKAELQASPGRERTWGRGRRGRVSVQPRWLRAAPRLQARAAVFH